jgi:hypothetical protein
MISTKKTIDDINSNAASKAAPAFQGLLLEAGDHQAPSCGPPLVW